MKNKIRGPVRILYGFELFFYFFWELIKANLQVAKAVLQSNEKLSPAIVQIPLDVKTDFPITLLANMITLTPGTLSLDVSKDRKFLFVHVLNTSDTEQTISEIKSGFERRLLRLYD